MEVTINTSSDKVMESGFSKWIGLVVLCMAQIGSSGDNTMLSVASSALVKGLGVSINQLQITNLIFPLVTGALMVISGMLGLIIGWRQLFRSGVALMFVGEVFTAMAPNILVLDWGARLVVGIGASLMIPAVLGLIAGTYQGKDRAIAFGAIGAATGIASFIAPVAAGWMLESFSWRLAFLVLAGYFILVFSGSYFVKNIKHEKGSMKFDYVGACLTVLGLFLFIIGISKVSLWGVLSPLSPPVIDGHAITIFGLSPALPLALLGLVILLIMLRIERYFERSGRSVLIPSSFMTIPQVRDGILMTMLIFMTWAGVMFISTPYLELIAGFSPVMAGVSSAAMGLPLTVFSLGVPKFFPEASAKHICRAGILLIAGGTGAVGLTLQPEGVSNLLFVGLVVFGAGLGLLSSQASVVVANAVSMQDAQQSGGVQATSRNVGQSIGVAIAGAIMLFSLTGSLQAKVQASSSLTPETKAWVASQKTVNFLSDSMFDQFISTHVKKKSEADKLVHLNAVARADSARKGLFALALISLLFLFGTCSLPERNKKPEPHKIHHHWWN